MLAFGHGGRYTSSPSLISASSAASPPEPWTSRLVRPPAAPLRDASAFFLALLVLLFVVLGLLVLAVGVLI